MKLFQKKQQVNPYKEMQEEVLAQLQAWVDERMERREKMSRDLDACIAGIKSLNKSLEIISQHEEE